MNHDLKTAEREYFLLEKKKYVAATTTRLREVIRMDFSNPTLRIGEIFATEIKNRAIRINDVREKMKTHVELKNWDEFKLRDNVRYMIQTGNSESGAPNIQNEEEMNDGDVPQDAIENIEEYSVDQYKSSSIAETEDGFQRRRVKFTDRDLEIIREECNDIICSSEPINTRELRRRYKASSRLAVLKKKYGFNSLKVKMRTERNKHA